MQNIAPRVVVYAYGTQPPPVEEGWLALAQFDARPLPATTIAAEPPLSGSARSLRHHTVFGDGSHATTRLCAGAVDLLCRQRPGLAVLDVGTGTGILARIARARGASFVAGTDIDPAAIACARAHAELDEIGSPGGLATDPGKAGSIPVAGGLFGARNTTGADNPLCAGSTAPAGSPIDAEVAATAINRRADIHLGTEAPDHWGPRFDLVVANILEAPLHALAPALCRALASGGVLLLSGFTRPQAPALRLAYETAALQPAGDFTFDDWVLLKFSKEVKS